MGPKVELRLSINEGGMPGLIDKVPAGGSPLGSMGASLRLSPACEASSDCLINKSFDAASLLASMRYHLLRLSIIWVLRRV